MNMPSSSLLHVTPALLLARLTAIGQALRDSGQALALIGLGSVGIEMQRLDAHSDLDFFAIVEPGCKARFIDRLDWLAAVHPLSWHFRNTADGHKALMMDGVFCEFAVFEPAELAAIPFAAGRVVWRRDDVDPAIALPRKALPGNALPDEHWLVSEALSCLFVGLQRWHRGERLSALRFVQGHALQHLIELDLLHNMPAAGMAAADPFSRERRLEQRQPALASELPALLPGYAHTRSAALALLDALARRGMVLNVDIESRIRELATARF
jgi:hypothetical protein